MSFLRQIGCGKTCPCKAGIDIAYSFIPKVGGPSHLSYVFKQRLSIRTGPHMRMSARCIFLLATACCTLLTAASAQAEELKEIKRTGIPGSTFPISLAVSVPANTRLTFISGTLADVANPDAPKGSYEAYGNTETQTTSILKKIEKLLAAE